MYDYFLNDIELKNLIFSNFFLVDLLSNKPRYILNVHIYRWTDKGIYDRHLFKAILNEEYIMHILTKFFNIDAMYNIMNFFLYYHAYHFYLVSRVIFAIVFFFYISLFLFDSYNCEEGKNIWYKKFCDYLIIFLRFLFDKLENIEESFYALKFIIFMFSLVLSNLFFWNSYINFIVFIEWNLPVCFGMILIFELLYLLGSYMFLYLNGSNSRKIIVASFFEDLINFFILIIRIFLQFIRGIICAIYHDLLREANIVVIRWLIDLDDSLFLNESNDLNLTSIVYLNIFLSNIFYLFIVTFGVTLVFLQALFLCLAIWLFCKCWFISIYESKFFIKDTVKNKQTLKNYFEPIYKKYVLDF